MKRFQHLITVLAVLTALLCCLSVTAFADEHREQESNNSFSTANSIALETSYSGNLSSYEDVDYFRFTIPQNGYFTVSFSHGGFNSSDQYYNYFKLQCYDANGERIAYDASRAIDRAGIDPTGVTPGTYYFSIEKGSRHTSKDFHFSVHFTANEFYEHGNNYTFDSAINLKLNRYMYGFAGIGGDYFRFEAEQDVPVDIYLSGEDLIATLYNSDQKFIAGLSSRLNPIMNHSKLKLSRGTYYIVVKCDQTRTTYGTEYNIFITDNKHIHQYDETVTAATCTESGFRTSNCSCGHTTTTYDAEALGHEWGEWHYTDPNATGVFDEEERLCARCDARETHDLDKYSREQYDVAPTCTEEGYTEIKCWHCNRTFKDNFVPALGHSWNNGKVTKEPTLEEEGEMKFTCKTCKETKTEPIPKRIVNPFTDVSESDWYYNPVMWAKENNITGGTSATTFGPNDCCTRAQVVTFLWAANGKPEPASTENSFTDVSNDAWYLKPVLWAVEQGITGGVAEGKFGPDQTCTRAQIVTFLYAAAGKPTVSGSSPFEDVADTDWYVNPVIWAKENEVTGGISATEFGPNQVCTRAQVVTFLYKVYG